MRSQGSVRGTAFWRPCGGRRSGRSLLCSARGKETFLRFSLRVLSGVLGEADCAVVWPEPSWGPGREPPRVSHPDAGQKRPLDKLWGPGIPGGRRGQRGQPLPQQKWSNCHKIVKPSAPVFSVTLSHPQPSKNRRECFRRFLASCPASWREHGLSTGGRSHTGLEGQGLWRSGRWRPSSRT